MGSEKVMKLSDLQELKDYESKVKKALKDELSIQEGKGKKVDLNIQAKRIGVTLKDMEVVPLTEKGKVYLDNANNVRTKMYE